MPAAAAEARGTAPHGTESVLNGLHMRLVEIHTLLRKIEGPLPPHVAEPLHALAALL